MPTETKKETPAQYVERVKREKASWSIMEDIRRYSREGFASITPDDLNVRMRAWGIYTQGDGLGTRGDAVPFFMMRIRTPNGALTAEQAYTVAGLSEKFARNTLDVTDRQNFQLHWLTIEDLPTILDTLGEVGLTSMGSCGDNTRTVTGCPIAGFEPDEVFDASPHAIAIDRFMNGNPLYANLPRKFKFTITGCGHWCTYPEINDIGATAVRRGTENGFHFRVGGGLSTRPHLGQRLNAFVPENKLLEVVQAVTEVFRESDELRVNRAKARMKFLFLVHGWTAERFLDAVHDRLGYKLDPAVEEKLPNGHNRDHVGVHRQKQGELCYAGYSVRVGRIGPEKLRKVAQISEEFGDGTIRMTPTQNILIANIPVDRLTDLLIQSHNDGLKLDASGFERSTISCTGTEFCKLAITETKNFASDLVDTLEQRLPGFSEQIRIHVTGCPNSCGQHWIADVGLQGVLMKVDGKQVEAFEVSLGGGLGQSAGFARRTGFRAPAPDIADALQRLFEAFRAESEPDERFRRWLHRVGDDHAASKLSGGTPVLAEEVTV